MRPPELTINSNTQNHLVIFPNNQKPDTDLYTINQIVFSKRYLLKKQNNLIFKQGLTLKESETSWIDVYLIVLKHPQKLLKLFVAFLHISYDGHVTFYFQGAQSLVCPSTSLTKTTGA